MQTKAIIKLYYNFKSFKKLVVKINNKLDKLVIIIYNKQYKIKKT